MKYAIMQCATTSSGTNYTKVDEKNDLQSAIIRYHGIAAALWNDANVVRASITILDENLDKVSGYNEVIVHQVEE